MHRLKKVRLVNGVQPGEGRLEIYHAGQWGTICDDGWDVNDVSVACRQLGYRNGGTPSVSSGFGFGSGTIWLDNVDCVGTETRIEHCPSQAWGDHNCGHDEDAGVYCYVPFD
ncbi:hypothetical protein BSL78_24294 [Apostichopus japonicus]|uniref:SRCR domain-containing protein n=1 Tax=Stichopus japonicus TaxID=307972 RepID=A0A2G8JSW7_STIJA|nr:hypothetical protein BSL78_24294 [Apostichopus japonicus]